MFLPRSLATRGALAGLLLAGIAACEGSHAWTDLPTGAGGNRRDASAPSVKFEGPTAAQRVPVGDSVLVQVRVSDDVALDSVTLSGFSLRGSAVLGTQRRIERFSPKVVALRNAQQPVREATILRHLLPTSDSLPEQPVFVVATARDTAGNVRADTVRIALGGPSVAIASPVGNAHVRAGSQLRVRVVASDRDALVSAIRLIASQTTRADTTTLRLNPARLAIDTTVVITVPDTSGGQLQLQASAQSTNSEWSHSVPTFLRVLPPTADQKGPTVQFSVRAAHRVELSDSVYVKVTASDSSRVARVGITVIPTHLRRGATDALKLFSTEAPGDSAILAFTFAQIGAVPDQDLSTVRLEITAFALDTLSNCGAATMPGAPTSLQCEQRDGFWRTGERGFPTEILLTRGTTVRPPSASDRLVDLVSDASTVFVSNHSRGRVEVLPVTGTTFSRSISVGSEPWGLALGRTGDSLLVANSGGTNISVVSLASLREEERIRIPDVQLYSFTFDSDSVSTLDSPNDFSDRPQYVAQLASGHLLYSTKPTPVRSDGTVRIVDRTREQKYEANRGSEIFTGYASRVPGKAIVVNAFSVSKTGRVLEVCPRRRLASPRDPDCVRGSVSAVSDSLARLSAAGLSDTRIDRNADIRSIGLSDTTFVAISRDRSTVAFGEGARAPGRVLRFESVGDSLRGSTQETGDLIGNAAERVIGLALNGDGTLGIARGQQAYFFDHRLRLQGKVDGGAPAGGGAIDPSSVAYGAPNTPRPLSFVSGVDDRGLPFIDIIDAYGFRLIRRVHIRDRVAASLIAVPVTAGDPESGRLAMRLFAITSAGVVKVELRAEDLQ